MSIAKSASLLVAAAGAAAMLFAPTAAADPECTDVGGATRCSNPGNVQINTSPTQTGPYLPYGCVPSYSALCYDAIPGISIDTGGRDHDGGGGGGGGGRHPRR